MRVAIVDDEWYGLDITYRMLTQIRKDLELVAIFQDPKEALEKIPQLRPDLIILDVEMPYLNGFDVYDQLKELPACFWMVSAHGEACMLHRDLHKNVRLLTKPFSKADMITLLSKTEYYPAADFSQ